MEQLLRIDANELRVGDLVMEDGSPLYCVAAVSRVRGFRIEIMTTLGFPITLHDVDEVEVLREVKK